MGRINAVLDEEVDYGFEGGGRHSTSSPTTTNGFSERDSRWKYPIHEYEASFGDIKDDARDFLVNVLMVVRGKRHDFMFKDWNDFTVEGQQLICGAVGTTEQIQLYKRYAGFGQAYTIRPIQALKEATIYDVSDAENPVAVPGTLDLLTGLFTPDDPWDAGPYELDAEFYVWVHLDDDYNPITINSWQANTARVRLVESPIEFTATNVPESWDE